MSNLYIKLVTFSRNSKQPIPDTSLHELLCIDIGCTFLHVNLWPPNYYCDTYRVWQWQTLAFQWL